MHKFLRDVIFCSCLVVKFSSSKIVIITIGSMLCNKLTGWKMTDP